MHKLKIIHKDIKPDNILYSTSVGDYVISDFGISQTVV
jgi:serine/threonine protein kinase